MAKYPGKTTSYEGVDLGRRIRDSLRTIEQKDLKHERLSITTKHLIFQRVTTA